jgi:restriction system protein
VSIDDGNDYWPVYQPSPDEYERAVARLVESYGHELTEREVTHLDKVEGVDGTYIIDVTVRFRLDGQDFLVLYECKRHSRPVERADIQVLHDKLRSTGAQKGVVVAASGFQRGALEYAKAHSIACARLVDAALIYETRDRSRHEAQATGNYVAYAVELTEAGFRRTLLTGEREHARAAVFDPPQ